MYQEKVNFFKILKNDGDKKEKYNKNTINIRNFTMKNMCKEIHEKNQTELSIERFISALLEKEKSRNSNKEKTAQNNHILDDNYHIQKQAQNLLTKVAKINIYNRKNHYRGQYNKRKQQRSHSYTMLKVYPELCNNLIDSNTEQLVINKEKQQEYNHRVNSYKKYRRPITVNFTKSGKAKVLRSKKSAPKTGGRPPLFPTSLPPFDNPKDGLLKTLLQMENPEWEVVMLGLQGLVRLCRHHTKITTASSHSIVQSLVNNIRNLRSQVSRGSCQVAKELFDKVGRFLDAEVEDLAGTLLSRTADTNKFLRGDALAALESMVDHSNPVRSVAVLINKGAKHQNALVRCSTARLLLRLAKRLGAERTLSLPRETKDVLVITTAKLLMEGSLDTRRHAKEIFEVLSADPRLFPLISEVVPNNIQRNINKSLLKIAARSK